MIVDFIFTKVPRFFMFLYRLICESMIFGIAGKIWRAFARACKQSFLGRLLSERKNEGEKLSGSIIIGAIDRFFAFVVNITGRAISALTFGSFSCIFTRILAKLRDLYTFLDYEFVAGVSIMFIFVCPGSLWRNVFGLGIAVILLFSLLFMTAAKKREVMSVKRLGLGFIAFVISTLVGVGVASDKAEALRVLIFFVTAFILTIVMSAAVTDKEKLKKLLGFVFTAVIATAVYGFYQRVIGVEIDASLTDLSANTAMPGRVFSTFENPNNYAEFLVLTIPLCFAYCSMIKQDSLRRISYILSLLPIGALLMTYSRSGWVSFAIAAVVFVFFYNKKLIPVLIVAAVACIPLLPETILARIMTIGSTADSSNMYRIYIWDGVMKMLEKYWVSGVGLGPGNFRSVYVGFCNSVASPAPHSHMLYLEIWVELGVLGIVSYLGMLFSLFRRSVISLKYASKNVRTTLIAGCSGLVGILFASAAEYIWYYPRVMLTYFIVVGLMYACINIAHKEGCTK